MASVPSFYYPRRLLHTTTESPWFPPTQAERETSLDSLERQEQTLQCAIRAVVLPELTSDPIGLLGDDRLKLESSELVDPTTKMTPVLPFWKCYQGMQQDQVKNIVHVKGLKHQECHNNLPEKWSTDSLDKTIGTTPMQTTTTLGVGPRYSIDSAMSTGDSP